MNNTLNITKEDIAKEKLRRKKEKSDELQLKFSPYTDNGFWEFCKYVADDFYSDDKPPLKELCDILQNVTRGVYKKVLISVFRRFGKSRTMNMWIAWQIGYDVNVTFMRNCYSAPLSIDLSRKTLGILTSAKYKDVFPDIRLDPKMNSKLEWKIDKAENTTYFGTGIEGSIIGRGCKTAAILDDPIKNAEEALNDSFIDSLELFIETVHNTCIDPSSDCAQIIISTRWSPNDPIGQRIDDPSWLAFTFPALDENNKSICEAIISTEKLIDMKTSWERKGLGWMFESMYQCNPISNLVSKFNVEEMKRFKMADIEGKRPDKVIAFMDYANKGSDYLSMPIAYCYGTRKYIVDVLFSSDDSKKLKPLIVDKILKYKPSEIECETNHGGQEFVEGLEEELEDILEKYNIELIPRYTKTNKEIRILVRTGTIKETCYFLDKAEQSVQYKQFFDQLCSYGKFRKGHDDAPDSMAGLVGMDIEDFETDVEIFGSEKKYLDNNNNNINTASRYDSLKNNKDEEDDDDVVFF